MTSFGALFGGEPAVAASAPGRVNLIGEHTDYNGGYVLPIAIPRRTEVRLRRRMDDRARVASAQVDDGAVSEYRVGDESPGRGWLDYVQGLTAVLGRAGHAVGGFDAWIASDVPLGGGVASSAALEVALLRALRAAFELPIDDVRLAQLGQRAENEFVGARVGIMDQMAASLADERRALFLDTRSLEFRPVDLPAGAELVVVDTGVAHGHAGGEYNKRRAECEQAGELLGVAELRDVGSGDLERVGRLPEPLARRARHVVTENERVLAAVVAIEAGDLETLGALFLRSHASLRDDYEVSVPELDLLVELAAERPDVFGARMTGGGFGGSAIVLARAGSSEAVAEGVARGYAERLGRRPTVLVPIGAEGGEMTPS